MKVQYMKKWRNVFAAIMSWLKQDESWLKKWSLQLLVVFKNPLKPSIWRNIESSAICQIRAISKPLLDLKKQNNNWPMVFFFPLFFFLGWKHDEKNHFTTLFFSFSWEVGDGDDCWSIYRILHLRVEGIGLLLEVARAIWICLLIIIPDEIHFASFGQI